MQRVRGFICPGLEISISERAASTAIQQRICNFNCRSNGTEQILHLRLSELFPTIVFSNSTPKGSVRVSGRRSNFGCFVRFRFGHYQRLPAYWLNGWLVRQQDHTKTTEQIYTKLEWGIGLGSEENPLPFGEDLDVGTDAGYFFLFFL